MWDFIKKIRSRFNRAPQNDPRLPQIIRYRDLVLIEKFDEGMGGCSTLSKVQWGQQTVVFKKIKSNDRAVFENEYMIQFQADHPNILTLLGIVQDIIDNQPVMGIVMTFMVNGDLSYYLENHKGPRAGLAPIRKKFARETTQAIAYLHSQRIIHRDIKSENILLDQQMNTKLTDFGFAKNLPDNELAYYSTNIEGSPGWLAPEAFNSTPRGFRSDTLSDVYVLGILYSVLFGDGTRPYERVQTLKAAFVLNMLGVRPDMPVHASMETRSLLNRCWGPRNNRPSAEEILEDEALRLHF